MEAKAIVLQAIFVTSQRHNHNHFKSSFQRTFSEIQQSFDYACKMICETYH